MEYKIRELLWLYHGCQGLYGDDGEMQCGNCRIDFKRDSEETIYERFSEIQYKAFQDALKKTTSNNK